MIVTLIRHRIMCYFLFITTITYLPPNVSSLFVFISYTVMVASVFHLEIRQRSINHVCGITLFGLMEGKESKWTCNYSGQSFLESGTGTVSKHLNLKHSSKVPLSQRKLPSIFLGNWETDQDKKLNMIYTSNNNLILLFFFLLSNSIFPCCLIWNRSLICSCQVYCLS